MAAEKLEPTLSNVSDRWVDMISKLNLLNGQMADLVRRITGSDGAHPIMPCEPITANAHVLEQYESCLNRMTASLQSYEILIEHFSTQV